MQAHLDDENTIGRHGHKSHYPKYGNCNISPYSHDVTALAHDATSCLPMGFKRGILYNNSLATKELHLHLISGFWNTHVASCMVVVLNEDGLLNALIGLQLDNDT